MKEFKSLLHSTWKTFDTRFGSILQSLQRRRELLESEKNSASLDHVYMIRKEIEEMYRHQVTAADAQALQVHRATMTRIKERLLAPEYFLDQQAIFRRRETGSTGQWIFEDPQYISWADVNNPGHSVLYINGIPGAGK